MRRVDISTIVRNNRTKQGLSQSELAALAGVSISTIKAIETNRMQGSPKTLMSLSKALNCDVLELLYGDN